MQAHRMPLRLELAPAHYNTVPWYFAKARALASGLGGIAFQLIKHLLGRVHQLHQCVAHGLACRSKNLHQSIAGWREVRTGIAMRLATCFGEFDEIRTLVARITKLTNVATPQH